jgi:hypothetical protein
MENKKELVVELDGYQYSLKKIDSTHVKMTSMKFPQFSGTVYHVEQLSHHGFHQEMMDWIKRD